MAIVQTARATPIMISRRPCHDLARWRSSPNSVRDLGRARIHSPRSSTGRELGHHIGRRWRLRLRHSPGCEAESEHRRRRSSGSARASTSTRVNSRITAVARLRLLSRDGDVAAVQAGELASQGERQARLPRPCRGRGRPKRLKEGIRLCVGMRTHTACEHATDAIAASVLPQPEARAHTAGGLAERSGRSRSRRRRCRRRFASPDAAAAVTIQQANNNGNDGRNWSGRACCAASLSCAQQRGRRRLPRGGNTGSGSSLRLEAKQAAAATPASTAVQARERRVASRSKTTGSCTWKAGLGRRRRRRMRMRMPRHSTWTGPGRLRVARGQHSCAAAEDVAVAADASNATSACACIMAVARHGHWQAVIALVAFGPGLVRNTTRRTRLPFHRQR